MHLVDGVPDDLDGCPSEPNPDQADSDGDAVCDSTDRCPGADDDPDDGPCGKK